ncbi:MAG: cation:proton antiporter [Victivallales bacterium]|jgi:Kef-type K+ transport system membrane component KefB/mannitol/fructose-specific phosphotransferase system IIA component (Ntr-type)
MEPVSVFALLAVILLVIPLLSRKLKIPAMVGLILTGALIGPKCFNLLDFNSGMKLLSSVGLLYIMFIAGLEIDLNQFLRQRFKALIFGFMIFGIAMAGGMAIGHMIPRPGNADPVLFCILMGALMSSQTLLTYPLVSRLGLAKNLCVTVSIGATLLTDILALVVLSVVANVNNGESQAIYWLRLVFGFVCLAALSIYILPRIGRWFYRYVSSDDTAEYLFLFFSLLFVSAVSKLAGLEPIVGAFLAGLSLNSLVPDQSRLMNRVQFVGNTLFIPIFLISVGMLVDYNVFLSGINAWAVILLMLAVAVGAKLAASFFSGLLFKFSKEQYMLMFGMVVNKAGVTIATAIVGYNIGLFGQDVLNGAIVIIFMTCLIGPWITEIYGRKYALNLVTSPDQKHHYSHNQRILVPLSNPTTSRHLLDIAFMIRLRKLGQPVFPVSVAMDGPGVKEDVSRIEKMLSQAVIHAAAADVPVHPETRIDTDIASCVARTAIEIQASCIIIGWDGAITLPKLIFGQVLDRLLEETSELILVCKIEQPVNTFGKMLIVIPPMSHNQGGFDEALSTAKTFSIQSGLKTIVLVSPFDMPKIAKTFASDKSSSSTKLVAVESWSGIISLIEQNMKENDLVFILSCRHESLAWQPALDQLPKQFIKKFPDVSLVIAYPAEFRITAEREANSEPAFLSPCLKKLISQERTVFGMEKESPEKALGKILVNFLSPIVGDPESVAKSLTSKLMPTVLEITDATVLMHVHWDNTEEAAVLLGTSAGGIIFEGIENPAKAVFVLLSPASHSPENHLKNLSDIARFVLAMKNSDSLGKMKSLSDLEEAVREISA